jgi:hypothetical protein
MKKPDPVEKVWYNSNYGQARALKGYAGYPLSKSVNAIIPHGVFFEDDYVFPGEINAPVPAVLNWPMHRDGIWSQYKEVVPSAAPFLYAHALYPHAKERRGTLVMPQHTTTLLSQEFDWWAFADSLKDLPGPVRVLLYYNDVQQDVHKYFRYPCKTCGHVNDQQFLERLVYHLTSAEYVVSNDVGSFTYYSTLAANRNIEGDTGAKFRIISDPPRQYLNEQGIEAGYEGIFHNSEDRHPEEKRRVAETAALFRVPLDEPVTPEQVACSEYYLRKTAFKSPEGLRKDLEYIESLKYHKPKQEEGAA